MNQITNLKNRIFKNKSEGTELTPILELIRELGCFSDIIGRDFEVLDKNDNLIYKIRQKPISIAQMRNILTEFYVLKKLDSEREVKKWGKK